LVPLGLEGEPEGLPLGDEVPPEPVDPLGGDAGGLVVVGGDADGARSPPGCSPTRSVCDSPQAVSSPALSARAQRPVSTLFISSLLCEGCA
jgi:hypothetical protein